METHTDYRPLPGHHCIAFAGGQRLQEGGILEVALAVREHLERAPQDSVLVFDRLSSRPVDLNVSGDAAAVEERYAVAHQRLQAALDEAAAERTPEPAKPRRGRPKLGVVGREVTLLPRHWEWLEEQPGSASVTLRKLVENARKTQAGEAARRRSQESTYRFMLAMAGDRPGYEEALRALYAGRLGDFEARIAEWPGDVRDHISRLAAESFEK